MMNSLDPWKYHRVNLSQTLLKNNTQKQVKQEKTYKRFRIGSHRMTYVMNRSGKLEEVKSEEAGGEEKLEAIIAKLSHVA